MRLTPDTLAKSRSLAVPSSPWSMLSAPPVPSSAALGVARSISQSKHPAGAANAAGSPISHSNSGRLARCGASAAKRPGPRLSMLALTLASNSSLAAAIASSSHLP